MALVLTGQLLPAGSVSAQEGPLPPSLSAPASLTQAPTAPADDDALPSSPQFEEQLPAAETPADAPTPQPTEAEPVEVKGPDAPTPEAVAEELKATSGKGDEAAKAVVDAVAQPVADSESLPVVNPASAEPVMADENSGIFSFGDWTVTIRPGVALPRSAPCASALCPEVPQNSVLVPVTVNVNNSAQPQSWYPPQWGDTHAWNAVPTSAYLFQRPQPYWQQRSDFYHLRPFIHGLW